MKEREKPIQKESVAEVAKRRILKTRPTQAVQKRIQKVIRGL